MEPHESSHGKAFTGPTVFHTTHWSVITTAQGQDPTAAFEALTKMCSAYWLPLYAYARRRGYTPEQAEDLTQDFFRQLLSRDSLRGLNPTLGKFRSFLLTCLKNFLANDHDRANAKRRGGGMVFLSLETADAESWYCQQSVDHLSPDAIYEHQWALTVLQQTIETLRCEFAAAGKAALFEALHPFLPGAHSDVSRYDIAAKLGLTQGALDVSIHRLRHRFGCVLREHVAKTVSSPTEIDEEIRHLIRMLGQ